ncbi:YbhB/YbcL family Raf kinase inhibitor-like protein [Chitinasiproducens palmae]|uniref:Phospholipid-binding protein, PBP family n=1 Tax=Chitinasiproducens palmae TaxID=1770053 RepID=A0A1H2PM16_9BURK|nr:YbhB/YbcL family Raf kinase inhibitor-like protein [Chitinasiproducens palmae]SDV47521.1 phospholipid-binding protein, PBP family [Chitinasiproducens palmae]
MRLPEIFPHASLPGIDGPRRRRMRRQRGVVPVRLAVGLLAVLACLTSPPAAAQRASGASAPAAASMPPPPPATSVPSFTIVTPDAPAGAMLGRAQANRARDCGGENLSPALSWQGTPNGARSLALLVFDPDGQQGGGVVHWLRYGIPPDVLGFELGTGEQGGGSVLPGAGGRNTAGTDVYAGPCPPMGETPHHYVFQLFALDLAPDALPPGLDRAAFIAASRGHVVGYTSVARRYAR